MEQNTSNPELEQVLKEEKDLFNVLWVNIVQNLKETIKTRVLESRDLKMYIRKGTGCNVNFDCPLEDTGCRRVKNVTEFLFSSAYNRCETDVKMGNYIAHLVFSSTALKIDPIIIEFNYKGEQIFERPSNKHIISIPVTFDMNMTVFDKGHFSENGGVQDIVCKYINFSTLTNPKYPVRFMTFSSARSTCITDKSGNTCRRMYEKYSPYSLLEIVFPTLNETGFHTFQMGLVKCYELGLRDICYCDICEHKKNVWGSGSKSECVLYKKFGTPRYPNESAVVQCMHFKKCKNYVKLEKLLQDTPHIVHSTE